MMNFCNDTKDNAFADKVIDFLADQLLGKENQERLQERYSAMKNGYDDENSDDGKDIGVDMKIHNDFYADLAKRNKQPEGCVGLDLPTWFNIESKSRVMIVSQDPLRKKEEKCEEGHVRLSTPYGQHSKKVP